MKIKPQYIVTAIIIIGLFIYSFSLSNEPDFDNDNIPNGNQETQNNTHITTEDNDVNIELKTINKLIGLFDIPRDYSSIESYISEKQPFLVNPETYKTVQISSRTLADGLKRVKNGENAEAVYEDIAIYGISQSVWSSNTELLKSSPEIIENFEGLASKSIEEHITDALSSKTVIEYYLSENIKNKICKLDDVQSRIQHHISVTSGTDSQNGTLRPDELDYLCALYARDWFKTYHSELHGQSTKSQNIMFQSHVEYGDVKAIPKQ